MGSNLTHTVSGDLVNFKSADTMPIESLRVNFLPIQEGSGDPSPSNVRAINGWTGLSLLQCNKNILDPSIRKDNGDTVQSFGGDSFGSTNGDLVLPAGTYTFSTNGPTNMIAVYKKGGAFITAQQSTAVTFTLNETTEIGIIYINSDSSYNYQLEVGSIATEYVPYNAQTISLDWTSTAGTLYGGYIDLAQGKLVQTCKLFTFTGSETNASYTWKSYTVPVDDTNTADNNGGYNVIACSHTDKKEYGSKPWSDSTTSQMVTFSAGHQLRYRDFDNFTDLETAQNYLQAQYNAGTPLQVVVKLITPIIYPLSKIQLQTLLGQNNIWSNTNSTTEVTYQFQDHLIKKHLSLYNPEFIPPKYQKCDYLIQSNHNTKFDTGVSGDDQTLKIHCEFMPLSLVSSYVGILGNYQTESDNKCWRIITVASTLSNFQTSFYVCCGSVAASGTNGQSLTVTPVNSGETVINKKIIADLSYGTYTMTGTKTITGTHTKAPSIPASEYNIAIGSSRIATSNSSVNTTKFRLYNFKFRSQNKLIRNYVPVIRKNDRLAGFYDTVNGTFNPSVGNKEFIGGFEEGEILLPSGYTKMTKLIQTGLGDNGGGASDDTSYIRLRRKFNSTHRYRFIVNFTNSLDNKYNFQFFGAREQTNYIPKNACFTQSSEYYMVFYGINNGIVDNVGYQQYINLTNTYSEDQEIEVKCIDGLFITINSEGLQRGIPRGAMARESFESETDIILGGIACKGYDEPYYHWRPGSSIKLYEEYDENDNLITKFVPCIRNSDSIAGMYDIITNTFWPSDNPNYQFIAE